MYILSCLISVRPALLFATSPISQENLADRPSPTSFADPGTVAGVLLRSTRAALPTSAQVVMALIESENALPSLPASRMLTTNVLPDLLLVPAASPGDRELYRNS